MWFELISIGVIQAMVLTGAAIGYHVGRPKPAPVLEGAESAASAGNVVDVSGCQLGDIA